MSKKRCLKSNVMRFKDKMPLITIEVCKCSRCGYIWKPRENNDSLEDNLPIRCAKCQSAYWNKKKLIMEGEKCNHQL